MLPLRISKILSHFLRYVTLQVLVQLPCIPSRQLQTDRSQGSLQHGRYRRLQRAPNQPADCAAAAAVGEASRWDPRRRATGRPGCVFACLFLLFLEGICSSPASAFLAAFDRINESKCGQHFLFATVRAKKVLNLSFLPVVYLRCSIPSAILSAFVGEH